MIARSTLVLTFALAFTVFIILPAFLSGAFPAYSSARWGDVFDLLTPLAMIPLYWLLVQDAGDRKPTRAHTIAFLVLAALWAEGHGMHLAANSISNFLGAGSGALHDLVHVYDEVLSHYLWHLAMIALSALVILSIRSLPTASAVRWTFVAPAGILYGLTYFLAVLEGATVPLGLPAAVLIVLWILGTRRPLIRAHDLVALFLIGYGAATILFLGWFAYWRGLPQPSELGLI